MKKEDDEFSDETLQYQDYQKIVREELSFCRGTGYDKEKTAVVPLTDLAKREERRLKKRDEHERILDQAREKERRSIIPIGEIVDVLRAAASVEEVAGVLAEIIANMVPRVLLLWERDYVLYGFATNGMGLSEVKLLTIEVPKRVLWEMAGQVLDLESYRGPPQWTGQVPQFFEILGYRPAEVILITAQVTAEDRWVLYADAGEALLPPVELRLLEVIVSRAGARADLLMEGRAW